MTTQNCMEAAMFAASENYSLGVYEGGECFEEEFVPEGGEELRFALSRQNVLLAA